MLILQLLVVNGAVLALAVVVWTVARALKQIAFELIGMALFGIWVLFSVWLASLLFFG